MILPQMAVRNDNLLRLLLAYSASHRARSLHHPEPAVRIAMWTQGIFGNLRTALDNPHEIVSDVNLAAAIMLTSLEIISPKAFGVAIPWQHHLETAREMVAARGGPVRMRTVARGNKVTSFLWSWYAYLDVVGSLSGARSSSMSSAWVDDSVDHEDDYDIDCVLGYTRKCMRLLAKVAELRRAAYNHRVVQQCNVNMPENIRPSDHIIDQGKQLILEFRTSLSKPARPCTHLQSSGEAAFQWDSIEMAATNEMFHWAGIVHLQRCVIGKPSTHSDVQSAVREIFGALHKIRKGSSAEGCSLFPMFTAGCEVEDGLLREVVIERIRGLEMTGLMQ